MFDGYESIAMGSGRVLQHSPIARPFTGAHLVRCRRRLALGLRFGRRPHSGRVFRATAAEFRLQFSAAADCVRWRTRSGGQAATGDARCTPPVSYWRRGGGCCRCRRRRDATRRRSLLQSRGPGSVGSTTWQLPLGEPHTPPGRRQQLFKVACPPQPYGREPFVHLQLRRRRHLKLGQALGGQKLHKHPLGASRSGRRHLAHDGCGHGASRTSLVRAFTSAIRSSAAFASGVLLRH